MLKKFKGQYNEKNNHKELFSQRQLRVGELVKQNLGEFL